VSIGLFIRPMHTLFYLTDFTLFSHIPVSIGLFILHCILFMPLGNQGLRFLCLISWSIQNMKNGENRSVLVLSIPASTGPFIRPMHTIFHLIDFTLFNHIPVSIDLFISHCILFMPLENQILRFLYLIPWSVQKYERR